MVQQLDDAAYLTESELRQRPGISPEMISEVKQALAKRGMSLAALSSPRRLCSNGGMDTSTAPSYQGCRFPVEIIAHCVWLYFRFCLSLRDVQEMMLERGVAVSHGAFACGR